MDFYALQLKALSGFKQIQLCESRDIFKDPITDSGLKKSAKGLLRVEKEGDDYVLYDQQTAEQEKLGAFEVVFEDGKLRVDESLDAIRARLAQPR